MQVSNALIILIEDWERHDKLHDELNLLFYGENNADEYVRWYRDNEGLSSEGRSYSEEFPEIAKMLKDYNHLDIPILLTY